MANFEIHIAQTDEQRKEVYTFRYRLYVEELQKLKPTGADHERRIIHEPHDDFSTHYFVTDDSGEMCAVFTATRLIDGPVPQMWHDCFDLDRLADLGWDSITLGTRLMLRPDVRGTTVLPRLLNHVYQTTRTDGILYALLYCSPALVALYEQLGFRRYTDSFNTTRAGTYLIPMILLMADTDHLARVRSPFYRLSQNFEPSPTGLDLLSRRFPRLISTVVTRTMSESDLWGLISKRILAGSETPLLQGMTDDEVESVVHKWVMLDVNEGDRVVKQGQMATEMFVVLRGLFEVEVSDRDAKLSLGLLGPGDIFGEMAYFQRLPRTADVMALTDGSVLVLNDGFLDHLMRNQPRICLKVLNNLARVICLRLSSANQRVLEYVETDF